MKKEVLTILLCMSTVLIVGCTKEQITVTEEKGSSVESESSLESFAQILSAAVYNEPQLRSFIKEEALKEFDRDYDVFYPYAKDCIVSEGKSFREILQKYDVYNNLEEIEENEPLLNMLVPDWSWVDEGCFSVHTWDTESRDVVVTYDCSGPDVPLYYKGELVGSIKGNEFISAPVLVVKRNERMVYNPTKSGDKEYSFADSIYDARNKIETKANWYSHDYVFNVPEQSESIHPMGLEKKVRDAYSESKKNYYLTQRDYVYYDMTSDKDTGLFDHHYEEQLYRIRFKKGDISGLSDDSGDMSINNIEYNFGEAISEDALKQYGWLDGSIEIILNIKAGSHQVEKPLPPIEPKEAFSVKTVHFEWCQLLIGTVTVRKYYVKAKELEPKWIYIKEDLFTWNLSNYPYTFMLSFFERDPEVTITKTVTEDYSYATNFSSTVAPSGEKYKIGYGLGSSAQSTLSSNITITEHQGSDKLGDAEVSFSDPIVVDSHGASMKLKTYSAGSVEFQIIPIKQD